MTELMPTVSVVVATRDRPELLKRTLAAIDEQTWPGTVETLVVFDQSDPDRELDRPDTHRPVRVLTNDRTAGLAGARNTGALAASGTWLAFCDDDDEWLPRKTQLQLDALANTPAAQMATTGVLIRYDEQDHERIPRPQDLTFEGFVRDRMTEVHPSSFVMKRKWFLEELGMVDEELPGSYAEDYDLLLRAAKLTAITTVPQALVRVHWHPATYFRDRWTTIDSALEYLLAKFPEFENDNRGRARILGQQSFAQAAAGERGKAVRTIVRTARTNPLEPRTLLAAAVAIGIPPGFVMGALHRFGRGL